MKTRATVVPIAILFCRCFSPLLQSSRVLVCSVPPGSLTLLRYLFVFCTASLQPQTSPSPPTPCSSSFFFFFCSFYPCRVSYTPLFRHLTRSNLPGPPDQLFFLPVTVQISIPETPRDRWGDVDPSYVRASVSHTNREMQLDAWTLGLIAFELLIEKLLFL